MNFLPAAVVTERIREAHQNESAPLMMLFPGYLPSFFGGWVRVEWRGVDQIFLFSFNNVWLEFSNWSRLYRGLVPSYLQYTNFSIHKEVQDIACLYFIGMGISIIFKRTMSCLYKDTSL